MDRAVDFIFYAVLVLTSIKDLKEKTVPDSFNLSVIFLGFLKTIFFHENFEEKIIGMGVFPIVFIIIYGYVSEFLKKELIGFGDIKLMGAAGFYIGYSGIYNLVILYNIIFITALICVFPLLFSGKIRKNTEIPFAPFISTGLLIFLFLEKFKEIL